MRLQSPFASIRCLGLPEINPQEVAFDLSEAKPTDVTSYQDLTQKIEKIVKEKLAAPSSPHIGTLNKIEVDLTIPVYKIALERLRNWQLDEALSYFKDAFKLHRDEQDTQELRSAILELDKKLFIEHAQKEAASYLAPEEVSKFLKVIQLYQEQENPFPFWSDYIQTIGLHYPHLYYLSALLAEHTRRKVDAIPLYLFLAKTHSDPMPCLKKAVELVNKSSDPFALPHFLEKLDLEWLVKLSETIQDPELKQWLLLKDAIRMVFEECLKDLSQASPQKQSPTCFICFDVEELDVGKWLENTLVPDLDRMGIKPIFRFRELGPEKELNSFQGLIRGTDQVIIACTPELKKKCDERKKAPTGVAQEVRLTRERYNDPDKYETIFPLYLKGDRQSSCPSEFFEPILGTNFTYLDKSTESSVFSYYAVVFELFGAMRGISHVTSKQMEEKFLKEAKNIIKDGIDFEKIRKWRNERVSKNTGILKAIQERISRMTQMVNLPEAPVDFTGRKEELDQLHEACKYKSRVAVTGLGGVGKTALALKYANDYKHRYQFIHFMPAGTSQMVIDGLLKLADDLHIPKTDKIEERLLWLKTTLGRLEQEYLLIFDGLDQLETFEEVAKYLPERGHCLLLTTRMPEQSKIRGFELIKLHPFTVEEATTYLLATTNSQEAEAARKLAGKLGYLPLALTHAARYIRNRNFTIEQYIKRFEEYEVELFENKHLTLTKEEKTILTTWKMGIDTIEKVHRCSLAKEILEFFAFLGQAPIPLEIALDWFKLSYPQAKSLELDDALKYLMDYSMISHSTTNAYDVHLLVQSVIRYQMPQENQQKTFEQALKTLMLQIEPKAIESKVLDFPNYGVLKFYMAHGLALIDKLNLMAQAPVENQCRFMSLFGGFCRSFDLQQALKIAQKCLNCANAWNTRDINNNKAKDALAESLDNIGQTLNALGKEKEAIEHFQRAHGIRRDTYGEAHPCVAESLKYIGQTFRALGKEKEAIEHFQRAHEIRRDIYGEAHSSVAESLNEVGATLFEQGKINEALEHYHQALKILRAFYGEANSHVMTTLYKIGLAFLQIGRTKEAQEYLQQALKIQRTICGEHHPLTGSIIYIIGACQKMLGNEEGALEDFSQGLKILGDYYGENHPDFAAILIGFGSNLKNLGDLEESLENNRRALKIYRNLFGETHPTVAETLIDIGAVLLHSDNKNIEAQECFRQGLKIYRELYGENHPTVAKSLNKIGKAFLSLRNTHRALRYFKQALRICRILYGENHPLVAESLNSIGQALEYLGKKQEALEHYRDALEIYQTLYGEHHNDVAMSLNQIAGILLDLGEEKEALEYYHYELEVLRALHGENHSEVVKSLKEIGEVLEDLGRKEEAFEHYREELKVYQEKLKICRALHGENHSKVAESLNDLGKALENHGKKEEALEHYHQELKIWRALHGENHSKVAESLKTIGEILEDLGRKEEAHEYYREELKIYQEELKIRRALHGENHSKVAKSLNKIGKILEKLGRRVEALEHYREVLKVRRVLHGENHSKVAESLNKIGKILEDLGRKKEADEHYHEELKIYQEELKIRRALHGKNHSSVADSLRNIGFALSHLGRTKEALEYYEQAEKIEKALN